MISIHNKLQGYLTKKLLRFKYFSNILEKEPEDWEKFWPQLTVPAELFEELLNLIKGIFRRWGFLFALQGVKAAIAGITTVAIRKFWGPLEQGDWRKAFWLIGAFLILNGIQLASELGGNFLLTHLRSGLMCRLRGRQFRVLLNFPLKFHQRIDPGSIINHINRDVGLVVDMVTTVVFAAAETIFTFISVGIVVLWLDWKIGSVMVLVLLSFLPLIQLGRTLIGKFAKRLFAVYSQILTILQQSLYSLKYIKAMGFEQRESTRIQRILEEHRHLNLKVATVHRSLGPLLEFVYILLICGGIWIGLLFLKDEIKLSLIIPLAYALFRLFKPVRQAISMLIGLEQNIQAASRLFGTIRLSQKGETRDDGINIDVPITSIQLRGIKFGYESDCELLKGVDLELNRNEIVALMGKSGIGKTTLCDLIMGLYPNYQNEIFINDHELRQLSLKSYRKTLGYVPQNPLLIRGTIRENLLYGSEGGVKEEDIILALKRAHAWEFVHKLKEGLDFELSERVVNLSAGERQRLCLARALIRNPQVLILDEATSSLDLENESRILQVLRNLKKEMIILLVSHRFSITNSVDRIVMLEEGKIKEMDIKSLRFLYK